MTQTGKPPSKKTPKVNDNHPRFLAVDARSEKASELKREHISFMRKTNLDIKAIERSRRIAEYMDEAISAELAACRANRIYVYASLSKNKNLVHVRAYAQRADVYAKEALDCATELKTCITEGTVGQITIDKLEVSLSNAMSNAVKCETQASRYSEDFTPTDMKMEC